MKLALDCIYITKRFASIIIINNCNRDSRKKFRHLRYPAVLIKMISSLLKLKFCMLHQKLGKILCSNHLHIITCWTTKLSVYQLKYNHMEMKTYNITMLSKVDICLRHFGQTEKCVIKWLKVCKLKPLALRSENALDSNVHNWRM